MTSLFLYDDEEARQFEPYALTRPLSEMRAGAALLRERWEMALSTRASGSIVAPHLLDFDEADAPRAARAAIPAGSIVANSRCVVSLGAAAGSGASTWRCAGKVAAVRLKRALSPDAHPSSLEELTTAADSRVAEITGRWLGNVWNFITDLITQLSEDVATLGPRLECVEPAQAVRLGSHPVFVERGAVIEPLVCLDSSAGPIVVRSGATVRAFSRVVGPCVIGHGSSVLGDRVHACSIGERCVVRGEISESIMLGNANKAHDGFVGHSYLGRWVNLGAGTTTSNLKNTYGSVSIWTPSGTRDTGTTKLGTFFGDHVKTGIGLRLTTGSVLGAGSNIYGSSMPPKMVRAFSWGEGDDLVVYRADKFMETAERAMRRRDVSMSESMKRQLHAAHALTNSGS